ncbi:MAG: LptF/LptG family permease [Opitutales bacterium]|nr:LptF/LptG family permease [Opitutales bacterium]
MGVLHKYIFKQLLGVSLMTVGLFVFVLVIGNVIKDVMGDLATGKIDLGLFVHTIALIVPAIIPYALPMGILTAILLVFGRMSAQSEIVAIKASGRSIWDISAPVFFLAILASLFSVGINFYYAPIAKFAYKSILKNAISENPLQFIKPETFVRDFPGFVIYSDSAEGNTLKNFRIWELDKNREVKTSTVAKTATIEYNDETDSIVLTLNNASADIRRKSDSDDFSKPVYPAKFEKASVSLNLADILGTNKQRKKLSYMTFDELMKARFTYNPKKLPETPENKYRLRMKVQIQIQKNFAMAFSIFSMVILAVPLGIKAQRTETFANLAIALALALSYYLLVVIISWLEKYPHLRPDMLIWIPNLIFLALGLVLLLKASKN